MGALPQTLLMASSRSLRDALAQAANRSTSPKTWGRSRTPLTTAPAVEETPVTAWGVEETPVTALA
jgi:hypothetical protein